jgi:hypothetical protein
VQAFKSQLRRQLEDHGWEVAEVIDGDDWWADEFWKVQSRRNLWGYEIVLTFLVDPQWDAPRKRGDGVWMAGATEAMPPDRFAAEQGIAQLCVKGRRVDEELREFVATLDAHRNTLESNRGDG